MSEEQRKRGRPAGPPKDRVTIYLVKSTIALCAEKAKRRNETLPGYIARNFERLVEHGQANDEASPQFKNGGNQ